MSARQACCGDTPDIWPPNATVQQRAECATHRVACSISWRRYLRRTVVIKAEDLMRGSRVFALAIVFAVCVGGVALAAVSLERFIARPGEEPGFTPQGKPHVYRSARAWLASGGEKGRQLKTDTARLHHEGFVEAVVQNMAFVSAPDTGGGLSLVVELGSRKSARAEQRIQLRQDIAAQGAGATVRHFTVSGVPGARGFTAIVPGMAGLAANALFTERRCLLLVGDLIPTGNPATPVSAGVTAIYNRTNGNCP
jgi:hypothetical protein